MVISSQGVPERRVIIEVVNIEADQPRVGGDMFIRPRAEFAAKKHRREVFLMLRTASFAVS